MITLGRTGEPLAHRVVPCTSWWQKARGLMFRKQSDACYAFFFPKKKIVALHMFFVLYPIDVLWLHNNTVVEMKKELKPFRVYKPDQKATIVLELPEGTIKQHGITVGDRITFSLV